MTADNISSADLKDYEYYILFYFWIHQCYKYTLYKRIHAWFYNIEDSFEKKFIFIVIV